MFSVKRSSVELKEMLHSTVNSIAFMRIHPIVMIMIFRDSKSSTKIDNLAEPRSTAALLIRFYQRLSTRSNFLSMDIYEILYFFLNLCHDLL